MMQMSPPGEHVNEVSDVLSVGQTVPVRIREVGSRSGTRSRDLSPLIGALKNGDRGGFGVFLPAFVAFCDCRST